MAYTGKRDPVEWTRIPTTCRIFVYAPTTLSTLLPENKQLSIHSTKSILTEQIDVVCKACHGKIDTMNVVQMANNFTMGWCIECHRTTEVNMGNTYNQALLSEKLQQS